ncbi:MULTISPECIES: molybdate ABC transporter substrate-binding protein [Xenorhabdus]|uniref:Molybdate transport system substrate-binding protein n=1 Tax=Xenorhabdus ehlersii TaxID=290111 RepID=A0A2D0ITN9_9GAMM|nr:MULTISPECIES: molybdate ABC transporter substrate-binding protein [Xenorhabdus]MBC8947840.1 molybdate-binding periplasmic protein ModA [Xenorhabdus sp. TS4]MBC8948758.1 molybdate-binding periplasmic protein ModA [Xenorhabdus sp. TS4]PHM25274.1 molybdate-binding periplasmic protein ModA [Xenorhabdus ehlersii]PHM26851.1 molybdate-binding periplasmic protein ModA [Xenorhabdus ehlersii]RKE90405.1 molybdate transport system substrate-binding protein [Xenorhabdus ehlersii]
MKNKVYQLLAGAAVTFALVGNVWAADKVTVFAAASLTNALDDIAAQYKKEKRGDIVASYASSSTLARQIVQGAPADIFISADQQWMNYATDKQLIAENTRHTLLGNQLVLIAPKESNLDQVEINRETKWKSLLAGGRLAVGDPDHVPVGIYAKESLQYLNAWDTVNPLMARTNNVRSGMALVERAEVPLGIVYGSDAVASNKVKVVGVFPPESHKRVEYPMAIIKGHERQAVRDFYDYLKTPEAAAIFKRYGFSPL